MQSSGKQLMNRTAGIFGCQGQKLTTDEQSFFSDIKPVGYILFSRNADEKGEVKPLVDELRSISGDEVLILTDHEGGRVQRFSGPKWSQWLPPLEQCDKVKHSDRLRSLWLRYRIIASELTSAGINVNCVPVGDVATDDTHPVVRNRCYSTEVDFVAQACEIIGEACLDGGVLPVIKHIPGHGRPITDSHKELPTTDALYSELINSDFVPFHKMRQCSLGMMAHVKYLSLDNATPASQSKKIISLVRQEIGFEGLLMTDDISMSALTGDMRQRTRRCILAGCDFILHCNGDLVEMKIVADELGQTTSHFNGILNQARKMFVDSISGDVKQYKLEFEGICARSEVLCP